MMKLRYRILTIGTIVIFGLFIIFVVENELLQSGSVEQSSEVHGKQHVIFQRRFLNREETSKISSESQSVNHVNLLAPPTNKPKNVTMSSTTTTEKEEIKDMFWDLFPYTLYSPDWKKYIGWPPPYTLPPENPTLQDVLKVRMRYEDSDGWHLDPILLWDDSRSESFSDWPISHSLLTGEKSGNSSNWEKFHLQISRYQLYEENSPVVKNMLHDMATQKIIQLDQLPGGTQLKLVFTFENGGKALFKPMRFPREVETFPNHFYFTDYERHVSEIASYHLDKVLGFRRAPPVIGRKVNITAELYPLAKPDLLKTFFVSPAGNVCFHGQCSYYCDTGHAFCGNPDIIEGSMAVWLPPKNILGRRPLRSPWRRSYNKRRKAVWEGNTYYCIREVKTKAPYSHGRRLYDAMDTAIFDFLTGNMDRHHYDEITTFGNDSTIIHWDHGRGFGRSKHDEMSILSPLLQCCVVRLSTFNKLFTFNMGPKHLSDIMRESLADDPVAPVLLETHLLALDRRVSKVLDAIRQCLDANSPDLVFLDDIQEL